MALGDITVLKEQGDGSFKETKLVPVEIGAQYTPILAGAAPAIEPLKDGQEWIRTTDFQKFFLYNDGDSRSWVQLPPPSHSHNISDIDGDAPYDTTIPDATVNIQVGGATPQAASTWKQKTVVQALDSILFPTISAQLTANKSATLIVSNIPPVVAGSPANTYEVGTIINNLTLTANLNKGTITNGNGTTVPLVGNAVSYEFLGGDPLLGTSPDYPSNVFVVVGGHRIVKTQNSNTPVPSEYQNKWNVKINHSGNSDLYYDNKGNQQDISSNSLIRGAGSVNANSSPVLIGVFPWYYLKSPVSFSFSDFVTAIQTGSASHIHAQATLVKKVSSSSGTISIPYALNNEYLGVAYDSDTTIKQTYWTSVIDSGPISSLFSEPSAPTIGITVPPSTLFDGWTHPYVLLITSSAVTNPNSTVELRNS